MVYLLWDSASWYGLLPDQGYYGDGDTCGEITVGAVMLV